MSCPLTDFSTKSLALALPPASNFINFPSAKNPIAPLSTLVHQRALFGMFLSLGNISNTSSPIWSITHPVNVAFSPFGHAIREDKGKATEALALHSCFVCHFHLALVSIQSNTMRSLDHNK